MNVKAGNVTQFGGNNVATGTGAGGAGIPRVTVSNDSNVLATQSGTWTVQPGNTANTTAWKVDGSAVTQPVSFGTPATGYKFFPVKAVAVTAGTPVAIWTPQTGKKFHLMGGYLAGTGIGQSIMLEDATGNEFLRIPLQQGNATYSPFSLLSDGYLSSTANNALFMDVTVSVVVSGYVYGTED